MKERFAVTKEDGTQGRKDVATGLRQTRQLSRFFWCSRFHGESNHQVREEGTNTTSDQGIDEQPVEEVTGRN